MYYQIIKNLIEDEFKISGFNENIINQALEMLNELFKNEEKLSSSREIILVSAIAFLVLSQNSNFKSFREIAQIFGTDAKKVALKSKEIALILNIDNFEDLMTKGISVLSFSDNSSAKNNYANVEVTPKQKDYLKVKALKIDKIEDIEKAVKNLLVSKTAQNKEINDDEIIHLLKSFKKFACQLFKNKEYIEIKLFLKVFQNNLAFAGFDIKKIDIEEKFGNLFYQLGFEPRKGREPEKFVKLKDRFGQSEPYSLIKLGE